LLPPGHYEAIGGSAHVERTFKKTKVVVEWIVLVPDETSPGGIRQVALARYYNVDVGAGGRLRAGNSSNYRREWIFVTNRRPSRHDRLSPSVFKGVLAVVGVRSVAKNWEQAPLTDAQKYSVIDCILEVKAGGGRRHA
jgi:hypothetical protein